MGFINTSKIEAGDNFTAIPAGKYKSVIKAIEYKENSKKTGHFLSITHVITKGEYKGRQLWANLNIQHDNEVAQEIALKQFKQLNDAVFGKDKSYGSPADIVKAFKDKEVAIKVIVDKSDADRNQINGFFPVAEDKAGETTSSKSTAPWEGSADDTGKEKKKKKDKKNKKEKKSKEESEDVPF